MAKIAVLGLGSMGAALAACLVRAGHEVRVWNRTAAKAEPLVEMGATACATASDAVSPSEFVLICIKSHRDTIALIEPLASELKDKMVCDMSSGDTADAEELVSLITSHGAGFMLGMINAYPSGIGGAETTILTVSSPGSWERYGEVIRQLGAKSAHVGETPTALAALFAGLFTVRQGFMFGMINGAAVCQKAGIPMQVFADQIPASIKLVHDYYDLFARTVPTGDFDDPEASLKVYALALEDALKTFRSLGAPQEFIQNMHDQTRAAWDAGLGDKQLTVLATSPGKDG